MEADQSDTRSQVCVSFLALVLISGKHRIKLSRYLMAVPKRYQLKVMLGSWFNLQILRNFVYCVFRLVRNGVTFATVSF